MGRLPWLNSRSYLHNKCIDQFCHRGRGPGKGKRGGVGSCWGLGGVQEISGAKAVAWGII